MDLQLVAADITQAAGVGRPLDEAAMRVVTSTRITFPAEAVEDGEAFTSSSRTKTAMIATIVITMAIAKTGTLVTIKVRIPVKEKPAGRTERSAMSPGLEAQSVMPISAQIATSMLLTAPRERIGTMLGMRRDAVVVIVGTAQRWMSPVTAV